LNKQLRKDIIDWDVVNWSKALEFWESKAFQINIPSLACLELGAQKGGLSLWLALKGHQVICSDLESPEKKAITLHRKYNIENRITYQAINASEIGIRDKLDVIVLKSVLGGVSRNNQQHLKQQTIDSIYNALKPGGILLFAENLKSTHLHQFLRNKYTNLGCWNYLEYDEIPKLFTKFEKLEVKTTGFFGTFGRTEFQRNILGNIDSILNYFIPKHKKYIVFGVATK
jgi:SAM-dependent methyltransferase